MKLLFQSCNTMAKPLSGCGCGEWRLLCKQKDGRSRRGSEVHIGFRFSVLRDARDRGPACVQTSKSRWAVVVSTPTRPNLLAFMLMSSNHAVDDKRACSESSPIFHLPNLLVFSSVHLTTLETTLLPFYSFFAMRNPTKSLQNSIR